MRSVLQHRQFGFDSPAFYRVFAQFVDSLNVVSRFDALCLFLKVKFCGADDCQKVTINLELYWAKKRSRTIFLTVRELLFGEIAGKSGALAPQTRKCRICVADKCGLFFFIVFVLSDILFSLLIISRCVTPGKGP